MFSVTFVPVGTTSLNQQETVKRLLAGLAESALVESFAEMLALPVKVAACDAEA